MLFLIIGFRVQKYTTGASYRDIVYFFDIKKSRELLLFIVEVRQNLLIQTRKAHGFVSDSAFLRIKRFEIWRFQRCNEKRIRIIDLISLYYI
jgi:hypothetical protein